MTGFFLADRQANGMSRGAPFAVRVAEWRGARWSSVRGRRVPPDAWSLHV